MVVDRPDDSHLDGRCTRLPAADRNRRGDPQRRDRRSGRVEQRSLSRGCDRLRHVGLAGPRRDRRSGHIGTGRARRDRPHPGAERAGGHGDDGVLRPARHRSTRTGRHRRGVGRGRRDGFGGRPDREDRGRNERGRDRRNRRQVCVARRRAGLRCRHQLQDRGRGGPAPGALPGRDRRVFRQRRGSDPGCVPRPARHEGTGGLLRGDLGLQRPRRGARVEEHVHPHHQAGADGRIPGARLRGPLRRGAGRPVGVGARRSGRARGARRGGARIVDRRR